MYVCMYVCAVWGGGVMPVFFAALSRKTVLFPLLTSKAVELLEVDLAAFSWRLIGVLVQTLCMEK